MSRGLVRLGASFDAPFIAWCLPISQSSYPISLLISLPPDLPIPCTRRARTVASKVAAPQVFAPLPLVLDYWEMLH